MAGGFIISAPSSGSGKTTVTLALLRLLTRSGHAVAPANVGPDYIDPAFHRAASGAECINLDPWAMRESTLTRLAVAREQAGLVVAEGVMGLFDGAGANAREGGGSSADLYAFTGWPVILVVDAGGMAASAAAIVHGFATFRADITIAGVIFNKVGSDRHAALLREAVAGQGVPVLACLRRDPALALPHRHLGLVQAAEHPQLDAFMTKAADALAGQLDTEYLLSLASTRMTQSNREPAADSAGHLALPPLGQRISVANDKAFAFNYAAVLNDWRAAGAEVTCFSPLNDEAPSARADAVYLPGGYPELHAGKLATSRRFLPGLRQAATRGAVVFGECGGYMVLGESIVDKEGAEHAMAGCLPVHTSFARPRMKLGYRVAQLLADTPLGSAGQTFRGHEFHFAEELANGCEEALFACHDAAGRGLGRFGARRGPVMGSFVHLIDRAADSGA